MRQLFFKLLPYLLGALLGLVFFLPDQLIGGVWRYVLITTLLLVGVVAITLVQLATTLPETMAVKPAQEEVPPPAAIPLLKDFQALGFDRDGPVLCIRTRPATTVWPFVNKLRGCTGSVSSTKSLPEKVICELTSEIEGGRGELTSVADPHACALPLPPGHFRQLLRGAALRELLEYHLEAQVYLQQRGVRFARPPYGDSAERIRQSALQQRQAVFTRPVRSALVALWRTVTKRTPFEVPVAAQVSTESTLRALQSEGPWSPV